MKQATIAIEDKEFYQHQGFSIKGMIRAGREMFTNKRVVQGGSTITQQLIKSALLSRTSVLSEKLKK